MGTRPLVTDEEHITERVTKPQSWSRRCRQLVPSSLTPQPAYPAAFRPGLPGTALWGAITPTVVCPFVIPTNQVSQLPKRSWNSDLLTAYRPRWGGPTASRVAAKRQLSVTYDSGSTLGLWRGCLSDGGRWKTWLVLIEVYIPLLNSHLKIAVFVAKQKQKSIEAWAVLYVSRSPGCVRLGFKKKKYYFALLFSLEFPC